MPIYLSETTVSTAETLTPRQIVAELDKHVVGQAQAKRAVAIALRNRTRRQKLPPEIAEEIAPKNILMIGPTGVGKTEIARRLARLAQSPFIKVEASKFTEVGYVGRDVESMVRDLVQLAVDMVRSEKAEEVREKARQAAVEALAEPLEVFHRFYMDGKPFIGGDKPSIADIRLAASLEFLRAIDYQFSPRIEEYLSAVESALGDAYSEPAADVRGFVESVKSPA